jgi:hypothetical protein
MSAEHLRLSRRERLMWVYRIAGPAGALALGVVTLLLFRARPGAHGIDAARVTGALVMVVVIMAWSFAFSYLTARQEDEYALSGAKFAWFWGGLIGLVCSVPVLAFIAWGGLTLVDPAFRPQPAAVMPLIFGYMLALVFQLAGYLVVRAWWGFRRP